MQIGNIIYTPIGYKLGYCIGENIDTKEKNVYYFKGHPDLDYKECEIIQVVNADVNTFTSDNIMGEGKDKNHKYFKAKIVKKGTGKILSQDWIFIPGSGIKCDDVTITFGMNRSNVRNLLSNEQAFNFSRGESEDSYEEFQNFSTWFRLTYNSEVLKEIEFLNGKLRFKNIYIIGGSNVKDVVKEFQSLGFEFHPQEHAEGLLCKELKVAIASSEDMGGDGDECEYFYTSSDITHLLEE